MTWPANYTSPINTPARRPGRPRALFRRRKKQVDSSDESSSEGSDNDDEDTLEAAVRRLLTCPWWLKFEQFWQPSAAEPYRAGCRRQRGAGDRHGGQPATLAASSSTTARRARTRRQRKRLEGRFPSLGPTRRSKPAPQRNGRLLHHPSAAAQRAAAATQACLASLPLLFPCYSRQLWWCFSCLT